MVRPKDHRRRLLDALREAAAETDANTIKICWCVVEHTPAYNTGGYYDKDIPAKNEIVSPHFDTEQEAIEWMNRHEPDEGKELKIMRRRLVRREYTTWINY